MTLTDIPIRRKVMAILLLTCGAVVLFTCAAFFSYELVTFRRTTVSQLTTLGEIIAANSTAALAFENQEDAQEILSALRVDRHVVAAALYDKRGVLFSKYPADLPAADLPAKPAADGFLFERSHLIGFQPVVQKDSKRLGTLYLSSDLEAVYDRFRLYGTIVVLVFGASVIIAYGLARMLQKQISGPILSLAETARAISERSDYSVRATKMGNDELGLLTDAFNQMLAQNQKLNQELEQRVVERTAQLEAANKELEAFSYSVSHDLRAPLRHVDGFAGLLANHAGPALDEKGKRFLATISNSARQMGRLIDDLLEFSRVGRTPVRRGLVSMDKLLAAVLTDGRYREDNPAIIWDIGTLPDVQADANMLRQVLANLVGNAVKYSGKNPQPRVTIRSTPDPATPTEQIFSVADNGVGFDMKYAAKLFGVFQRLHGATEFEGTGIGLANVRRIIARHGGRTWAEGRVGEGATFYFSLPITPTL
jgi:signal transduction histidine kinase